MQLTPLCDALGAEISGLDIADLTDEQAAEVDRAWAAHGLLVFREQHLTPEEHIAFAERFAPIDVNRFFTPVSTHPQIAEVRKEPDQQVNIGGGWHTDHSYDHSPARGSILVARELPPEGGDTLFAGVAAALRELPADLAAQIDGRSAVHSNVHVFGANANRGDATGRLRNPDGVGESEHPVVIAHPTTGEPQLYVNPGFTTHFTDSTRDESKPLLDALFTHIVDDRFTYRLRWRPGTVAMWDNRSTWHFAQNDYQGHRRLMHRITVSGEPLAAA
ncbi:MAG: TauD/TfdA family dioxygenase [Actinomycetota bacterium]